MINNMAKEKYLRPFMEVQSMSLEYLILTASGGGEDWQDTGDE